MRKPERRKESALYRRNRETLRKRARMCDAVCFYCGQPFYWGKNRNNPLAFTVDHVIPWSAGGSDRMENLVPAHNRCNRAKSDHLAEPATRRTRTATRRW